MLRFFTFWAVRKIEEIGVPEPYSNCVRCRRAIREKMPCLRSEAMRSLWIHFLVVPVSPPRLVTTVRTEIGLQTNTKPRPATRRQEHLIRVRRILSLDFSNGKASFRARSDFNADSRGKQKVESSSSGTRCEHLKTFAQLRIHMTCRLGELRPVTH
jgi:hypothetical protein